MSVCAGAGVHLLPFKCSCLILLRLLSPSALSELYFSLYASVWLGSGVKTRSRRELRGGSQFVRPDSNPGGGGSYSSIDADFSPGDGGLLSSVAAGCVAGKGRLTQLCRRWLLFPKGGSSQSSALSAWYPYEF